MRDVSPVPDDLLKPREVAELFGVRTTTIARWAREGKLSPLRTPGGHRRYSRADIRRILAEEATPHEAERQLAEDAVRLYNQGWSIRQVAGKFDYSYGAMRRLLGKHVTLRNRGGIYADIYPEDRT
ncbi:helix-turn-helix domain-containing protein [Actinoallomurus sp. CA-142502]|uniref:helix-turn-helix domain-containing protein n=1 Tax=Actinoallomurus sp. CA-142502 TaxID=3239885 RepID=UPI003D92F6D3